MPKLGVATSDNPESRLRVGPATCASRRSHRELDLARCGDRCGRHDWPAPFCASPPVEPHRPGRLRATQPVTESGHGHLAIACRVAPNQARRIQTAPGDARGRHPDWPRFPASPATGHADSRRLRGLPDVGSPTSQEPGESPVRDGAIRRRRGHVRRTRPPAARSARYLGPMIDSVTSS